MSPDFLPHFSERLFSYHSYSLVQADNGTQKRPKAPVGAHTSPPNPQSTWNGSSILRNAWEQEPRTRTSGAAQTMKFPPGTGKSWSWMCPAGIWFRHILKRKAHSTELQRSTGLAAWFGSRQLNHLIIPPSQHSQGSFYCITHSAKKYIYRKRRRTL